jgi:hypothetical protein
MKVKFSEESLMKNVNGQNLMINESPKNLIKRENSFLKMMNKDIEIKISSLNLDKLNKEDSTVKNSEIDNYQVEKKRKIYNKNILKNN